MEKETLIGLHVCAVLMFIKVAGVDQVHFQLVCPEAGFIKTQVNTVECTVRGSGVKGASCVSAVAEIKFESVGRTSTQRQAGSPFPACDNNRSSVNNYNGRCVDRDTNTDIYTYQFEWTPSRTYLTNHTFLRCFADCSLGPDTANPFKYKISETCGAPLIFVAPELNTTPTDTESNSPSNLVIGLGVAGGVFVVMAAVCCGVYCIRKPRSGGQQNAPPADAQLPANFPPDNTPPHNAPLHNAPPAEALPATFPPHKAPLQNAPPTADSAGPSSGQPVVTTPDAEPEEASVASTEASEASQGGEDSASVVSEV